MSVKLSFRKLMNLSSNDDYLKKTLREIKIVGVEEQSITIEVSSLCVGIKNNSILVHFFVEDKNVKIEIESICKLIEFETMENNSKLNLRLVQYDRKEWEAVQKFFSEKQAQSIELLEEMRGR